MIMKKLYPLSILFTLALFLIGSKSMAQTGDLSVVMTVDNPIAPPGSVVVFTIVATNNGPDNQTGVSVSALLPSGYTYISHSTTSGSFMATTDLWNIGNLNVGESQILTITSFTNQNGNFNFLACISGDFSDPVSSNNCMTSQIIPFTILAFDDIANGIDGTIGSASVINILTNDIINGGPVAIADVTMSIITPFTHPNIIINPNTGDVSVAPNTPNGLYIATYLICDISIPNACDTGYISIEVINGSSNNDYLKLIAFYDINNNGVQDTGEINYTNGYFGIQKNTEPVLNSYGGIAIIYDLNPANLYNLNYTPLNSTYNACSTTFSNVSIATGSGETILYFPITIDPYTELSIHISQGIAIPGNFQYNYLYYRNNGNQLIPAGTVTYTKDPALTISSISQAGTTSTPTGFTYDFVNLLPGENRFIHITSQVATIPTVSLGEVLSCSASITPTDAFPTNNISTHTRPIVGSYDPNDITEIHGEEIVHSTFTSNDYLTYTIRFENTGTANAITVKVDDVLDAKLDETSIRMIGSSHTNTLQRIGSNLSWKFDDIQLPPSIPNTQTGHGYIIYEVKPKPGYAVGDIIPNIANIYFDFNPAIVTNTWNTEFVTALSNEVFAFEDFTFYPNPTKNNLSIANKSIIDSVEITSILGQKVIAKNINALSSEIDLSSLSNGIYFVKLLSDNQTKTVKVIKE